MYIYICRERERCTHSNMYNFKGGSGCTHARTHTRTHGWMHACTDARTHGRIQAWVRGCAGARMKGCEDARMHAWTMKGWCNNRFKNLHFIISLEAKELTTCMAGKSVMACDFLKLMLLK